MIFQTVLYPALFSFLFTLACSLIVLKFFPQWGLLDKPQKYGLNRSPIPYSGGLVIFLSFLLSTLFFVDLTRQVAGLLFGAILITFVSFMDDRFSISPYIRLIVQGLVGVIVVLGGIGIRSITNPFGDPIVLDSVSFNVMGAEVWLFSALVIIAWLILMMNVMNWLDGIPGLTSGIGMIGSIILFILSIQGFHIVDQTTIIILSISLAASLFAFWFFDISPPRMLMGDTGSMLVGFLLGVFAVFAGGKLATVLLIMGFPVLDALWIIGRRIMSGQSPFEGDLKHFHHRLLKVGLTPRRALFVNYILASVFGGIALSLDTAQEKIVALGIVFVVMTIAAVAVTVMESGIRN